MDPTYRVLDPSERAGEDVTGPIVPAAGYRQIVVPVVELSA